MIEVKDVPPHRRVVKEEPRKKEGLKRKKEPKKKDVKKVKEDVASVKTKEEKSPVKTKKMTKRLQRALIRRNQVKKSSYGL
jgi:hypothetical protein